MGLLITPSGIRIPFYRPFYTKGVLPEEGRASRGQTEFQANLNSVCRQRLPVCPQRVQTAPRLRFW